MAPLRGLDAPAPPNASPVSRRVRHNPDSAQHIIQAWRAPPSRQGGIRKFKRLMPQDRRPQSLHASAIQKKGRTVAYHRRDAAGLCDGQGSRAGRRDPRGRAAARGLAEGRQHGLTESGRMRPAGQTWAAKHPRYSGAGKLQEGAAGHLRPARRGQAGARATLPRPISLS